ncbi:tryptophan--tRNA ligase [Buchnera aphidicola (Ceratovacuna keduensis)]|uniref:tryptophan--tRNA ligase n=1 Tax=Buchnera aphidicola TaxID=9 RepID=UPI0031B8010B
MKKKNKLKKKMFSAIQPTGFLTLANYLGVLKHWKHMQKKYKCIFCVADLHSLTNLNKKNNIKENTLDTLAFYLACGINPDKSIIFVQSHINTHCKMNWILNCFSYFGELSRMTQFKNKSKNHTNINIGLFNYPVLMMSDILLYNSDFVFIGNDQKQHLELTKVVANRFNNLYGNVFTIPKNIFFEQGSKIMSLQDPRKKMSKSDKNNKNSIFLLDNKIEIYKKIQFASTDSDNPAKILYNLKKKPGISNLLNIFSILSNNTIAESERIFNNYNYYDFKKILSNIIYKKLYSLQKKYFYFRKNENYLLKISKIGAKKAYIESEKTLKNVEEKLFLYN